jgi:16S rRNA (adenine1518-N6/adenine1519-N6)-dimethyltransferase
VARKSWGQHFLAEEAVYEAILQAARPRPGSRVVEIGAGLGTLTARLLDAGAEVWAVERDRDLCAVIEAELGSHARLRLCEADAVRFDYGDCGGAGTRPEVVGNLPYHLTGRLLFALLRHHAKTATWVLMVQREVADRLCAAPGSRRYGGVTVALSRVRAIDLVCPVSRTCFVPSPRVDSALVRLVPRSEALGEVADADGFLSLVRAAFQRRRKTLANALAGLVDREEALAWCAAASVDPRLRPEQLGPEDFAALQRAREARGHTL